MRLFRVYLFCFLCFHFLQADENVRSMQFVYNSYVRKGHYINTEGASTVSWAVNNTAFNNAGFMLWDYVDGVSTDLSANQEHFDNLVAFISANNIKRVIIYIKDPSNFSFFDETNTSSGYFIDYTEKIAALNCEVEVFFDNYTFNLANTTTTPNPNNSYPGYLPLPTYFNNLPGKMLWTQIAISNGAKITGVTIDPEGSSSGSPKDDYQLLIDFMDYYRAFNNLTTYLGGLIRTGVTLGIDSKNITYPNVSPLPIPSALGYASVTIPDNFPPSDNQKGLSAPQWRPGSTYSLLDCVYIQAYESDIPYIFSTQSNPAYSGTNNPTQSGVDFLRSLRGDPYLPGPGPGLDPTTNLPTYGQGRITYTASATTVTGIGTAFQGVNAPYPPAPKVPTLLNQILDGMFISVNAPGIENKIGESDGTFVISPQSFETYTGLSGSSSTNVPFYQTEIVNNWNKSFIEDGMQNKIYFMFSFEYDPTNGLLFFGNPAWSLPTVNNFMTFFESVLTNGSTGTTLSIYKDVSDNPIAMPANNFVLYDFFQLQKAKIVPTTSN